MYSTTYVYACRRQRRATVSQSETDRRQPQQKSDSRSGVQLEEWTITIALLLPDAAYLILLHADYCPLTLLTS